MPDKNETTTKFKADISELKSAFQEAQRQVRLANSEFKAATSGMDNWSESADGLSAKIKQLNSVLDSEKTKLASLERQYELTAQEQGENSRAAQELLIKLNNQRASVGNVEKQLKSYTSQLSDLETESNGAADGSEELAESVEDAGKKAEKAEGGFTVLKGALASLVADGIKNVISSLGELATDSSNAFSQFSAATGVATDAMGEYETAIENVYKNNFGESLEDVAEKMARVKEVTGELDAGELEKMTEKAITLEDVFGMDMTESLRGAQSLMTHFGVSSDEAFDMMASGAQNGLNYTDELGDNVSEYAGKFAEAGYSAEEYFQLLQNGADGGAYNLDKVNDAINEVTTRLADGTIEDNLTSFDESTNTLFRDWQNGKATQQDVIDSIVNNIQNTTNEQEKMNLAAAAFGTMAEDGGTKFVESLTSAGNSFDDVTGKANELAELKYDTPQAALQGLGRTLKTDLLQPLVDRMMPYLDNIVGWVESNLPSIISTVKSVGESIKSVINFISQLTPLIAALGVALAGLALVGLIQNIGAIGGALKVWAMSTKLVTAAQWLLNAAMSANPITLIVIGIAALVAAFAVLWNKSEAFRNFWIGLWENIKKIISTVVDAIVQFFTNLWENIKLVFSAVGAWFSDVFNAAVDAIKAVWDTVVGFFQGIWEGIKKVFSFVIEFYKTIFLAAWEAIKIIWDAVSGFFQGVWNGITNVFSNVTGWFKEKFQDAWDAIKNVFSSVGTFFGGLWDTIKDKFTALGTKIGDAIGGAVKSGINGVLSFIENTINNALSMINSALSLINKIPGVEIGKFDMLELPRLAKGGVVNGATTAVIGEDGREAVVPLEKNTGWLDALAGKLADRMPEYGNVRGLNGVGTTVYNFNQTNNSPKSLSRLEIYRQSKNLLSQKGGV